MTKCNCNLKRRNQTRHNKPQSRRPSLAWARPALPFPCRHAPCAAVDFAALLLGCSWVQVGPLITGSLARDARSEEGRKPARADGATDARSCANLLNSKVTNSSWFVKHHWAKIHGPGSLLFLQVSALGRGWCSRGDTHHAPIGAVQRSRKGALSHFLPMLTPSSPADGSQDSYSLHQPHMTLCEKCVLLLHAHEPRSASQGKVLCRVWEAWSTKYCRAYRY